MRGIYRLRRLPDGGYTHNPKEYLDKWHKLGKRIERALNRANPGSSYVMCAFDPDIQVVNMEKEIEGPRNAIVLSIPVIRAILRKGT